jgi:hypothetical protein
MQRHTSYRTAIALVFALAIWLLTSGLSIADDLHLNAQNLSDSAFAILNSLTSDSSKAADGDVTGAMASFAGDAQTLSTALTHGDREGTGAAMTALIADRRAVDEALLKNPGAIDSSKWASLKAELASIQARIPADGSLAKAAPPERPSDVVRPPASEAAATVPDGSPPRVEITSRVSDDSGLHVKGFLQGTDLKSAGIYDGDAMIQKIDLAPTPGAQRVLLDFTLEQASPSETIRVDDLSGRIAEIHVASNSTPVVESGGHEKMIELGGGPVVSDVPPLEVASGDPNNTAEIPSKSPSPKHMHDDDAVAPLTGVQINILGVQQSIAEPNSYQVMGQIAGSSVKRAGIYIDGRLVKPIPVSPGADSSFSISFTMFGSAASIRAYGNGDNFVESSIDLSTANGAVYGSNPPVYPANPYVVNPYASNPYSPTNPYSANSCPPGYGMPAYGGTCQPLRSSTSRPWWSKIF